MFKKFGNKMNKNGKCFFTFFENKNNIKALSYCPSIDMNTN